MITELLAGNLFHLADIFIDLGLDLLVDLTSIFIILCACFCCDGKALGYRKTDVGHLSQVCSLTTKQISHAGITLGE